MRIIFVAIIVFIMALSACQTTPRYGNGKASRPAEEQKTKSNDKSPIRYNGVHNAPGLSSVELNKLSKIINSYLGMPYKGRYKKVRGVDCSQLVQEVLNRFNGTKMARTSAKQYKQGQHVQKKHIRFGDLVFFRTEGSKVSHVGIFIENNEFVHASSSKGVIISSLSESYWKKRLVGFRRVID